MDPEVLLQLEEQLRQMNELLAQQNAMMASQMGAMKNNTAGFNSAFRGFNNGLTANGQTLTKYAEAQKKVVEEANASAEKWRNGAQMVEKGLNTFGSALNSTAGIVGSFAGALLSSEKGFSKFGGTVDAAAGAAQGLASSIPGIGVALGAIVGTVGKIVSKVAGDALKLTDAIVNLRDETVKTAGALPTTSEGMLQLANNAKYFGENIQVLGKITQGVGTGLASLGMTAGHGATKFMEMANVSDEVREQFGKMGISQEELTQMQATYIKQQQSSGMALSLHTKSVDQLRKESLKYAQDLNALSAITGKQADQLRAEQETAAAVLQEKIAQRQDMIEIDRLRKDGRHAEAAELEAKAQATAKFRDTMSNLVGPEQTAQIMRVIRTGVYDGVSGPMANLGLDFEQIRSNLAQGKDGMAEAAGFADQLRGAQDKMLTNFGQAALFLDDESFKSVGGNLESLSRLSDTYGKTNEEMLAAARKSQEERKKGSPMDDAIEKARAFERNLQQRYQDFLINGIKKAAALLNATDLNKLATDAMALAAKATKIALVGLAGATGLLIALKVKEKFAAWEAKKAQAEFTRALKDSTSAMREMSRASRSASAADRQEAAGSNRARSADVQEANASNRARAADTAEARSSQAAARADTAEARASTAAARADLAEARASNAAAKADMREAASGGGGGGGRGIGGILARGAMAIGFDQVLGQFGVGDMTNVDEAQLQSQDDQNWERASTWEKIQSSIPRGIEHLGKLFMLDNISNQARMDRIKSETEYLNKTYGTVASPKSPTQDTGVDAELEKQLAVLGSISMPGNGQDMMQMMSPEQLAALGITAGTQYTAKKGDTLKQIAEQHGISTDELLKANPNLKNKDWKEGYKLNIPTGTTGSGKYTIQQGDTLSALAAQYGTTVEELMKANPNITNPDLIYTGGKLNIPGQGAGGSAQQMMEQLSAMAGPEMAQKLMEQIQSGQFANPQEALKSLGINMDQALAGMGTATGFMNPNQLSQLAFARPQGENPEEAMTEMAKGALEENASLYTPLLEDMTNQREQQTTTFNEMSNSMRIFKNRTDATNKAFLDLMDAADELYEALTGRKRDRGGDEDSGPSGGSTGGNTVGSVDPEKVKQAQQFFESKGWTKEQAAGLVGNLITESKLDPTAVGDNGKAYGIAQWHPDRQAKFAQQYGKDIKNSTFEEQLAFVDWELRNNEKTAGQSLAGARTASEAAAIVDKKYERSSGAALAERQANAERIAKGDIGGLAGAARDTARDIRGAGGNLNLPTASSAGGIVPLGRALQGLGLRVSEHPEFGGVLGKHSKTGGHYDGTAIDVNVGTGMVEANDPKWGPFFDEIALAGMRAGYHTLWRTKDHHNHIHFQHSGSMGKNSKIGLPQAEKGGVFKGPDSGYLAMLHGKEAVVPLDNKFTRTQSSESYTVNGKAVGKKEYDAFMKANPQLQQLQDKVQSMMSAVQSSKADPTRLMQAATSLMDTNLTGIKDEIIDKNKKIQDSITQMVATETNKAIKAVNEANLPMQTMANQMSGQMRKVMEAHTQSMNELAYKLSEMIDAMNTSNDTTKKILKKANA